MGVIHIAASIYTEASRFPRHDALMLVCDGTHATPRIAGFIGTDLLRQAAQAGNLLHQAALAGWSPLPKVLCPECARRK
jgi:hypothetical protein